MKQTIWKYQLEITSTQILRLPEAAEILSIQLQGKQMCLWALVNPDAPTRPRLIETFGTGHSVPTTYNRRFISTVQFGELVFHYFELLTEEQS